MSSLWAGAANRRSIRSKSPKRSAIARRKMRSFTCDVGLPTVWAARYLAMNGKRRLIGSFWHGSMANATSQAIGAQAEFPRRQVISLSGDGGFTMLMGNFLTLVQHNLPVKVVVFNNGALGFIEIEQKSSGFLPLLNFTWVGSHFRLSSCGV